MACYSGNQVAEAVELDLLYAPMGEAWVVGHALLLHEVDGCFAASPVHED